MSTSTIDNNALNLAVNEQETRPLLSPTNETSSYRTAPTTIDIPDSPPSRIPTPDPVAAKRSKSTITRYLLFGLVTVGLIAIGIRSFIKGGDFHFDLGKALKKAWGGGITGAAAMVLQVLTLMPLRTVMNYQYRYGTTTTQAIRHLHASGWTRFYQGLTPALIQGPLSRFGDTAAYEGIKSLLDSNSETATWPDGVKALFISASAAAFRILLTPVDTFKTTMQTQGKDGVGILIQRVKRNGIHTLWYGAIATAAATFVGNYPWSWTFKYLDSVLPIGETLIQKLSRSALIGFAASLTSDLISNSLRVLKTYRQVNPTTISYVASAREIIRVDGWKGLFGRGLKTRIIANGLQGILFVVLWRLFLDIWSNKN